MASTANGSIIQMHGPGTIILKQDTPKAPIVHLPGVWYAPEAAHRLLSVTALTSQGFSCKITDKTKIWDKQGKLVIQASALLSSTLLHWFQSKLIIPEGAVYSLQESNSYHLWHLCLGHTSKNALCHAHKHLKGIPIVTVCLLSHGIFLLSFLRRTHLLFGMCSYDWIHCLVLLSSINSSLIKL